MALTNLALWLALIAALGSAARRLTSRRVERALLFAAMMSAPTVWEAGFSFNLEIPLLTGCALVLAASFADPEERSVRRVLLLVALFVFAQSKLVFFGFGRTVGGLGVDGRRRTTAVEHRLDRGGVGPPLAWAAMHAPTLWSEFLVDYDGMTRETRADWFYYGRTVLLDYRGLPLVVFLAAALAVRARARDWARADAGFAAAVVLNAAFFNW